MAKTTGPLFSLEASGSIGSSIVYSRWKGQPYARRLVLPNQPRTADQIKTRNAMRVMGAGIVFANLTATKPSGQTGTDKVELTAAAPSGMSWANFLAKSGIGSDLVDYDAATALYTALQAGEKTAWGNAAAALTPAIGDCAQGQAGGGYGTALSKGEVFFHFVYGCYKAGITTVPGATPPTYA